MANEAQTHNNKGRKAFTTQIVARGILGVETLSGGRTLTRASAQILKLDPGGASRNVTLPAAEDGLWFDFTNAADAAENLVIKIPDGTTLATVNQNEGALVACDATPTWTLVRVFTIALS